MISTPVLDAIQLKVFGNMENTTEIVIPFVKKLPVFTVEQIADIKKQNRRNLLVARLEDVKRYLELVVKPAWYSLGLTALTMSLFLSAMSLDLHTNHQVEPDLDSLLLFIFWVLFAFYWAIGFAVIFGVKFSRVTEESKYREALFFCMYRSLGWEFHQKVRSAIQSYKLSPDANPFMDFNCYCNGYRFSLSEIDEQLTELRLREDIKKL